MKIKKGGALSNKGNAQITSFSSAGFTFIELLVIVGIIGILASIILGAFVSKARDKAAVNAYKSEMQSVRRAVELCVGAGGGNATNPGDPGDLICDGAADGYVYPELPKKCGFSPNAQYVFTQPATSPIPAGTTDWHFTTYDNGVPESCNGCRLECLVEGCIEHPTSPGDCF
jgi:type II secretory pathway pseudopilin PulG